MLSSTSKLLFCYFCITSLITHFKTICEPFFFLNSQAQVGSASVIKKIDIFLDMCEGDAREFPMELHVMGTARVQDVIGLICWHYINDGYEPPLR